MYYLDLASITCGTLPTTAWAKKVNDRLTLNASFKGEVQKAPTLTEWNRKVAETQRVRIAELWAKDRDEENKLMLFALEYPALHRHWEKLRKECRSEPDWREYAKVGKFSDTPDDLVDLLENTEPQRLDDLSLEHTARRVRILKVKGLSQADLKKRANDIPATGYSSRHLRNLLEKGRKLLENSPS